ncbi:ADP-ribosylation factor-related [Dictyostelium discoideum AX4]|uniref:ADP-ribosylation factor-related n=1 Tax=Dictyostelium discoideum TaxID=44689 RepID=Q552H0_DICDI|nr:ADP-ribosylation factor-related [Dictyostelium discoideum AX4]EAL69413.1 ADP-ribosylation factor-related [Dictyostelium discoideum AX4]|eukprot:XP_643240.1 ADP-ribosylation factor-related [Dictyostelium discoideum AX4]
MTTLTSHTTTIDNNNNNNSNSNSNSNINSNSNNSSNNENNTGFNKASSSSRNRSGSINIGRNRSNSDSDCNNNNNNSNKIENDNESETNSKNTANSSPVLSSFKPYTNIVEYSKSEFNLMTKSLRFIDKNRYLSTIKCTILGLSGVGKTSFMRRFSSGEFLIEESTTFGAIRTLHMMHYSNLSLHLEIWDSGGHDRLRGLLPFYLSNANCVILMYDVCNSDSFRRTFETLSKQRKDIADGALIIVIGNKVDCDKKREVTTEQLEKKCLESLDTLGNISWCEISAKTGYNIREPFNIISKNISTMISILKSNHKSNSTQNHLNNSNNNSNSIMNNSGNNLSNSIGLSIFQNNSNNSNGGGGGGGGGGIGNSNGNLPTFFELDEESQDDSDTNSSLPSHIMSNPDLVMIRNNHYSCLERSIKPIPENVIIKLDQFKIELEPSINNLFNKFLSIKKKVYTFKEIMNNDENDFNNNSGNNSGNNSNNTTPGNSGEVKGSFCIIVDKFHPKRIEFKRKSSTVTTSDVVLLCDYRDHLIKIFTSLCPPKFKIPIVEGCSSSTITDFIVYFNDCLRYYSRDPIERSYIEKFNRLSSSLSSSSSSSSTTPTSSTSSSSSSTLKINTSGINGINNNEVLVNLNLSKMLKDEKYIISTSQSINWNASIETLDISDNSLDKYDIKIFNELLQSINNSVSIINLNLSNNSLNFKHKNSLVEFMQSMKLKSLDLSFNELFNSCNLIAQSLTHNSTLNYLSLAGNKLTNDNAQSLSQMIQSRNSVINNLNVSENLIEDEGALFLLKVQQQKQQQQQIYLNLQSNPIKHFSKFTTGSNSQPSSPITSKHNIY